MTAPAISSVGVSFLVTLVKRPLPSGDMFAALKSALGLVIGPLMLGLCSRCSPASDPASESLSLEQSPPSVSSHKDTEALGVFYLRCSTPSTLWNIHNIPTTYETERNSRPVNRAYSRQRPLELNAPWPLQAIAPWSPLMWVCIRCERPACWGHTDSPIVCLNIHRNICQKSFSFLSEYTSVLSSVLFSSLGALIPHGRFACDQVVLMTEFSDCFYPLMTEAAKGQEGLEEQEFLG